MHNGFQLVQKFVLKYPETLIPLCVQMETSSSGGVRLKKLFRSVMVASTAEETLIA
jgi:hypothetical protein